VDGESLAFSLDVRFAMIVSCVQDLVCQHHLLKFTESKEQKQFTISELPHFMCQYFLFC
jgi:hypothetical protein